LAKQFTTVPDISLMNFSYTGYFLARPVVYRKTKDYSSRWWYDRRRRWLS